VEPSLPNDRDVPGLCAGLWITEDGTRAMRVSRAGESFEVSVWRRAGRALHLARRPAKWHPPLPGAAASANAKERLGYLQVEVDAPGLGSTYDLMVATRNRDGAAFGGFDWRPVPPETPRDAVRLFPQGGASYYEAVLGYHDEVVETIRAGDRWMQPLSTWRPATDEEEAREPAPEDVSG